MSNTSFCTRCPVQPRSRVHISLPCMRFVSRAAMRASAWYSYCCNCSLIQYSNDGKPRSAQGDATGSKILVRTRLKCPWVIASRLQTNPSCATFNEFLLSLRSRHREAGVGDTNAITVAEMSPIVRWKDCSCRNSTVLYVTYQSHRHC